jgi:PTS system nitrogen regulatory IIA component
MEYKTMKLEDVLIKEAMLLNLKAREKREILEEMVEALAANVTGLNKEELLELLLEREQLGSTGIGYGVAIPHAKMKGIKNLLVSFARSDKGIDFHSTDEKPVHLFFLIVAPENATSSHLKILSKISRILKEASFRKKLLKARDLGDIYKSIMEADRVL